MTTHCLASVHITFELDTPVTFNGLTGTRVRWVLLHQDPAHFPKARLLSCVFLYGPLEGIERRGVEVEVDDRLPDLLPDWLPTPPETWDVPSRFAQPRSRRGATAAKVIEVEATVRFNLGAPATFDGLRANIVAWSSIQRLPDDGLPVIPMDSYVEIWGTNARGFPKIERLAADAPVPVGLPEPPAGWDAHVRAFQAQLVGDVQ